MSTFLLMLRLLTALAFVGGLLWFLTRAAKAGRFGSFLGTGPETSDLTIAVQRPLGKNTSVALVQAGTRHLLIGVSDHGVQLLAEGDDLRTGTTTLEQAGTSSLPVPVRPAAARTNSHTGPIDLDADLESDTAPDTNAPFSPAQAAPKHLPAMFSPTQPRMTLIDSLRELTVRE